MRNERDGRLEHELVLQVIGQHQPLAEPARHRAQEMGKREGKFGEVIEERAGELQVGLFVEDDVVDLREQHAGFLQAKIQRLAGERGIVLDARKAFFLGRRDDLPVDDHASRRVVVVARQADDDHRPA